MGPSLAVKKLGPTIVGGSGWRRRWKLFLYILKT